jgi:hypothetical protein
MDTPGCGNAILLSELLRALEEMILWDLEYDSLNLYNTALRVSFLDHQIQKKIEVSSIPRR